MVISTLARPAQSLKETSARDSDVSKGAYLQSINVNLGDLIFCFIRSFLHQRPLRLPRPEIFTHNAASLRR